MFNNQENIADTHTVRIMPYAAIATPLKCVGLAISLTRVATELVTLNDRIHTPKLVANVMKSGAKMSYFGATSAVT